MSAIATPSVQTLVKKSGKASGTAKTVASQAKNSTQSVAKKTTKNKGTVPNNVAVQAKEIAKKTPAKIVKKAPSKPTPAEPKRQYGLDDERAAELKKEKAYNAYREGSSYWCVVEALHSLGVNKMHSGGELIAAYQKVVDKDSFKAFKAKQPRNEATAEDWKGKILTNAYVTTRQDYGKRMRDIGWEVRSERTDDGQTYGLYRLNGKK